MIVFNAAFGGEQRVGIAFNNGTSPVSTQEKWDAPNRMEFGAPEQIRALNKKSTAAYPADL